MNHSTVIPCLHYQDANMAIEWLCQVLGFQKHLVVPMPEARHLAESEKVNSENGDQNRSEKVQIAHAELTSSSGMIMLGSASSIEGSNLEEGKPEVEKSTYNQKIKLPHQIGDCVTQSNYLVVDDADIVYQRAKKAGAKIIMDIESPDFGGRRFACADPEGHIWIIGTYNPWQ